jgi:hypothetical protein
MNADADGQGKIETSITAKLGTSLQLVGVDGMSTTPVYK